MNSRAFLTGVQAKLEPIAPVILPGIIKKQLQEVGATEHDLTPEQAEEFIKRICNALQMFLGPEGTNMARQMMLKELRKTAPEHFAEKALV